MVRIMKLRSKEKAQALRKKGFSISEIAYALTVAKSSVSLWVREIKLSSPARERLERRSTNGRRKAVAANRLRRSLFKEKLEYQVAGYLKKFLIPKN